MNDLWNRLKGLEGRVMDTRTGKPFRVESVYPHASIAAVVVPLSTGKARSILRTEFERTYGLLRRDPNISNSELAAVGASPRNPAYVWAMLTAVMTSDGSERTAPPSLPEQPPSPRRTAIPERKLPVASPPSAATQAGIRYTSGERTYLASIRSKLRNLKRFLDDEALPDDEASPWRWFQYVGMVRSILGNSSVDPARKLTQISPEN